MINKFLDKGSNGSVYCVMDKTDRKAQFVVKITKEYKVFAKEIKMMRRISKLSTGKNCCPEVVAYGMAIQKGVLMAWMIMPRYGHNLEYICYKMDFKLSRQSIYDIGTAIL